MGIVDDGLVPSAPDETDDLRPRRVRDGASRQGTPRACRLRMHLAHARARVFEVDVFVPLDEARLTLRSAHLRHLAVAEQREDGFTGQGYLLRIRAHRSPPVVNGSRILAASRNHGVVTRPMNQATP